MRFLATIVVLAAASLACRAEPTTQYSFIVENDTWGHPSSDLNYTMGVALSAVQDVTRTSARWVSLTSTTFTPDHIGDPRPIPDDRPFAELLYVALGRVDRSNGMDVEKEIRLGVLGTSVGRHVQKWIHQRCGCTNPMGWDNQIGQGGSPTVLYRMHWNLPIERERYRFVFGAGGELGYYVRAVTTAAFMFGATEEDVRAMRIGGPVSRPAPMAPMARPADMDVSSAGPASDRPRSRGLGGWIQYEASLFAYNELLQGAWSGTNRVKIPHGQIKPFVQHANIGVDLAFLPKLLPFLEDKEFHVYFTQSWRSADLKFPNRPRNHYWGGLTVSLSM